MGPETKLNVFSGTAKWRLPLALFALAVSGIALSAAISTRQPSRPADAGRASADRDRGADRRHVLSALRHHAPSSPQRAVREVAKGRPGAHD